MGQPRRYVRFNERRHDFIGNRVERLQSELKQYTDEDMWQVVYNMDGITEYIAQDLIEATVWQSLGLYGLYYEMYTDEIPHAPTANRVLVYTPAPNTIGEIGVGMWRDGRGWEDRIPRVMTDFNAALHYLVQEDDMTLSKHRSSLMVNWKATVNGATGYGNLPAWAVVHAWGRDRGLWD